MLKLLSRVALLSAAVAVFPGCLGYALVKALEEDAPADEPTYYDETDTMDETWDDDTYMEEDWDYDDPYATGQSLEIQSSTLAGDMGDIRDFSDDTASTTGWDYGSYSSLEVHAEADDGAAMAILTIEGGLRNPDLQPGAHLEFGNYEYTDNGLYVYMIGCSGPVDGNWEFDESAPQITLDVSEGPMGTTILDYTATFSDGQTVVGSSEISPLQAQ